MCEGGQKIFLSTLKAEEMQAALKVQEADLEIGRARVIL